MKLKECKIKRNFGFFKSYKIGDVRSFSNAEFNRFGHMLEPVNSQDEAPDKSYKKGRRKSK